MQHMGNALASDTLEAYMRPAVIATADRIENDLLNLYTRFTDVYDSGDGDEGLYFGQEVDLSCE